MAEMERALIRATLVALFVLLAIFARCAWAQQTYQVLSMDSGITEYSEPGSDRPTALDVAGATPAGPDLSTHARALALEHTWTLGIDDRDPRVTWTYAQRRGKPKQYAVEVEVIRERDAT